MKTVSVTDLMLIPELSHLRMIDFIDPRNDLLIAPYLRLLGFDTDYPVEYIPSQHRNMQGKVVIAYQIVGEIECNERFLSSSFATVEDRIIANGYKDLSLANQMSQALSTSRSYAGESEAFPSDQCNPDEAAIVEQINVLETLLDVVRPERFKEDGSLKTIVEYHTPAVEVVAKKERKKRSVAN